MKKLLTILMALTIIIHAGSGCKKGPIGPEGKQGEQGDKGDKGDKGNKGDKGDKGATGNANVSSRTFKADNIHWSAGTLFGANIQTATLAVPEITQDIINNGMVAVFAAFRYGYPWTALPVSYTEFGVGKNFSVGIDVGKVIVKVDQDNNVLPVAPYIDFRAVMMKGTAATSHVDLTKYEAVKSAFQIQD